MGYWAEDGKMWIWDKNKTKMCSLCSRGLTPQRHWAHEEACACKQCISEIDQQQKCQEAEILEEAIIQVRQKHVRHSSESLFCRYTYFLFNKYLTHTMQLSQTVL